MLNPLFLTLFCAFGLCLNSCLLYVLYKFVATAQTVNASMRIKLVGPYFSTSGDSMKFPNCTYFVYYTTSISNTSLQNVPSIKHISVLLCL